MNESTRGMITSNDTGDQEPSRETGNQTPQDEVPSRPREIGGRQGPEPTRYGDWEYKGRCIDF